MKLPLRSMQPSGYSAGVLKERVLMTRPIVSDKSAGYPMRQRDKGAAMAGTVCAVSSSLSAAAMGFPLPP